MYFYTCASEWEQPIKIKRTEKKISKNSIVCMRITNYWPWFDQLRHVYITRFTSTLTFWLEFIRIWKFWLINNKLNIYVFYTLSIWQCVSSFPLIFNTLKHNFFVFQKIHYKLNCIRYSWFRLEINKKTGISIWQTHDDISPLIIEIPWFSV